MSQRVISPPLAALDALPTVPGWAGERKVILFFDRLLPEGWEIYIQPHLNGLRPDLVLLHPEHGIAVFEVKDWDLDAMEYSFEGNPPTLHAVSDGKRFSKQAENPLEKVILYKEEIHNLYCPSLPSRSGFGAITAGVIFPRASDAKLKEVFGDVYGEELRRPQNILAGKEGLSSGRLESIYPLHSRHSQSMTPEVARELRSWLVEPTVSSEQRAPLPLDSEQKEFVTSRTASGYRRIKGAAGSGKTLVLAARAAELAREGKQVLVVTFNITLLNYLRDLSVRWSRQGSRRNITWLNFHSWGKRICGSTGNRDRYFALGPARDSKGDCSDKLSLLVQEIISENPEDQRLRYDAILVDEGQDFRLSWWSALRQARRKEGEMLLVADPTQDLYGTARAWTDEAMTGAGFNGPWNLLHRSYRLPEAFVPFVRQFAEKFLPADDLRTLPESVQLSLEIEETHLRWIQTLEDQAVEACLGELLSLPGRVQGSPLPWADVTFLTGSKKVGKAVVAQLEARGIRVLHTFYDDKKEERRRKFTFFKGAPCVKATTSHSFKGWESRALVVHLADLWGRESMAGAYAALTRLKRDDQNAVLSVVSSCPGFEQYGQSWPVYHLWPDAKAIDDSQDLAEFDLQWRSLMSAIDQLDGFSVESGDEVMKDGQVVDLDLACVNRSDRCLRLVDATKKSADKVLSALESHGHRVMKVRPDEPELFQRIISTLEQ